MRIEETYPTQKSGEKMVIRGALKSIEASWYRSSPLTLLLWPLSQLFRLIVSLRHTAYRRGLLKQYRPPVTVIIVGNITVGGSGKTPLVIWLAQTLQEQGFRPGMVSRGYGGQAKHWPQPVTADSDPQQVGDEPVLVARRTQIPIMVGPDRAEAVRQLLANHQCDVIISDDGLQHYALARDIEIVVLDPRSNNGLMLPAGPLREPIQRLKSVDFMVTSGTNADQNVTATQLKTGAAWSLTDGQQTQPLNQFTHQKLLAMAGIGNPDRFFTTLQQAGLKTDTRVFADHHQFSADDFTNLDHYDAILMTEKDAVKCAQFADNRFWAVPVSLSVPQPFQHNLLTQIRQRISSWQHT